LWYQKVTNPRDWYISRYLKLFYVADGGPQ
jgi:hypothetical protein